jgi:hypothetical protein
MNHRGEHFGLPTHHIIMTEQILNDSQYNTARDRISFRGVDKFFKMLARVTSSSELSLVESEKKKLTQNIVLLCTVHTEFAECYNHK